MMNCSKVTAKHVAYQGDRAMFAKLVDRCNIYFFHHIDFIF